GQLFFSKTISQDPDQFGSGVVPPWDWSFGAMIIDTRPLLWPLQLSRKAFPVSILAVNLQPVATLSPSVKTTFDPFSIITLVFPSKVPVSPVAIWVPYLR